jgi:multiple sugar transport system permease protein
MFGSGNSTLQRHENAWGLLFVAPMLVGILAFVVVPVLASLFLSFANWDLVAPPRIVGFDNYVEMFNDPLFYKVAWNTVYFTLFNVPVKLALALFVAVLLNQGVRGVTLYRAIYFMPVVTSVVAIAIVWSWLFNADFGLINLALSWVGIAGPDWLGTTEWAMPAVIIMSIWHDIGYAIVIYLAGLAGIPKALSESAYIDGASAWRTFWRIKLPMLSATTFFLIITNVIYSGQVFTEMFILTGTGPVDATNVLATHIYDLAFRFYRIGDASSVAYFLFLAMALVTAVQFKSSGWVYYED